MTEEISLSIEETNKLRASIGLAPIPLPDDEKNDVRTQQERAKQAPKTAKAVEEISIEETNKLRLSLGLKPIPVDDNSVTSREENEVQNFQRHQSDIRGKERDDEIKQRIDDVKARNLTRKRLATGKTLLEDDKTESTDDWLKKLGQPKVPVKKQKVQASESDELDGLRVGHNSKELSTLKNNEILTLKDTDILGEKEEDELTNESLVRDARFKKDLQDKLGAERVKNNVRGFQMDEDYNENDEADDNLMITGATIKLTTKNQGGNEPTEVESSKGHVKISNLFSDIEDSDLQPANDYLKPKKPMKMKKIKKKASQKSRNKTEITEDTKDEDEIIPIKSVELETLDPADLLAEDAELNSALSMKRTLKQKNRKHMTPEQIAEEVRLSKRWNEENDLDNFSVDAQKYQGGIVYDDTSDFLNSLSANVLEDKVIAKNNINNIKYEPDIKSELEIKLEEDDEVLSNNNTTKMEPLGAASVKNEDESVNHEDTSSPAFNGGLASTLKFLQSRQILQKQTDDEYEKSKQQREALKHAELLKLKISIESRMLREYLESDKSYMNLPKEEREEIFDSHLDQVLKEKNIISNTPNSRSNGTYRKTNQPQLSKVLDTSNYNPDVKLSYRDESGTELNTKEAFKYLSHKFHGVGPGKGKIDKKLKKMQQLRDKNSSNSEGII
ncbi:uncharacterized protein AC631_00834 [Debaryomyces fabryi]|uniref:SART-1 protein n=1 Tax=Debaryomyces fabryi TaxID=58627 RepID=A0A0V1Q504_9ASCO|nr:uncharacterized protein AC631_00834 [Debaryomyces fabryi]KSA03349.1 hypothetical protein AC631_00834 [Debaryomyces fabryi]CUM49896.1 unnamed protein product [Debaryomyces fabryi]